jgi:hypothetical protein
MAWSGGWAGTAALRFDPVRTPAGPEGFPACQWDATPTMIVQISGRLFQRPVKEPILEK